MFSYNQNIAYREVMSLLNNFKQDNFENLTIIYMWQHKSPIVCFQFSLALTFLKLIKQHYLLFWASAGKDGGGNNNDTFHNIYSQKVIVI